MAFHLLFLPEALLEEAMADKFEGLKLSVDRTPTIFVNGKHYWGDICIWELADRVDEELDMVRSGQRSGRIRFLRDPGLLTFSQQ